MRGYWTSSTSRQSRCAGHCRPIRSRRNYWRITSPCRVFATAALPPIGKRASSIPLTDPRHGSSVARALASASRRVVGPSGVDHRRSHGGVVDLFRRRLPGPRTSGCAGGSLVHRYPLPCRSSLDFAPWSGPCHKWGRGFPSICSPCWTSSFPRERRGLRRGMAANCIPPASRSLRPLPLRDFGSRRYPIPITRKPIANGQGPIAATTATLPGATANLRRLVPSLPRLWGYWPVAALQCGDRPIRPLGSQP